MTPTPASPVGAKSSGLRMSYAALAIVLASLAALLWQHREQLAAYRLQMGATLPSASMRYALLSGTMDETALQQHFASLPLRCGSKVLASAPAPAPASTTPGDRVCQASVAAVDSVSALALTALFHDGRLQSLMVQVPWWAHHASVQRLTQTLGAPAFLDQTQGAGGMGSAGGIVWSLAGGSVRQNRDPGWDPLAWSSVSWSAAASPALP